MWAGTLKSLLCAYKTLFGQPHEHMKSDRLLRTSVRSEIAELVVQGPCLVKEERLKHGSASQVLTWEARSNTRQLHITYLVGNASSGQVKTYQGSAHGSYKLSKGWYTCD
jgi:hypothetical protein